MTATDRAAALELYWHCDRCGEHETAQPEYAHGDSEPCVCGDGVARVMTLSEAAAVEQRIALGKHVSKSAYRTDGESK